uniref:Uncharacterized protein n=1 Tax=Meloidogyne hapla TaxID=6305 RepID=A0A1I8BQ62_MELHA
MKIQQLINCQQNIKNVQIFFQNQLTTNCENKESIEIKNENTDQIKNELIQKDNIFLPPLGSPSPTEIPSTQPQPISANSHSISSENNNKNFENLQKLFLQSNISYNSVQPNLVQALMILQQNNNNNQIPSNFPTIPPSKF